MYKDMEWPGNVLRSRIGYFWHCATFFGTVRFIQNQAFFDVQYLCCREVQECLMQPFYTLILIQMNVRNSSKHENKSSYSHRDKGNVLTRRVSQIILYAVKRVF